MGGEHREKCELHPPQTQVD